MSNILKEAKTNNNTLNEQSTKTSNNLEEPKINDNNKKTTLEEPKATNNLEEPKINNNKTNNEK